VRDVSASRRPEDLFRAQHRLGTAGKRGRVKSVFPGGNTANGFHSFYDYIITPDARRILVIKGGPGVGKSTFMAKTADAMLERGFDVELHHCSSDNGSLDGVVIPAIGVALIDGTAPHIVDPKNPGCVDEIIHLGDYWDEDGIRAHRREIVEANREVSRLFERAYRFLRAARDVYEDWEAANIEAMNFGLANRIAAELSARLFGGEPVCEKVGRERHLFASAITPDGMVNHLDTIIEPTKTRVVIEGDPGTGKSVLLRKIATSAIERGHDVELYHCALDPAKVEHVIVADLGVALTKSIEPHAYEPGPCDTVVDMNECLAPEVVAKYKELTRENEEVFNMLFDRAVGFISKAKETHDYVETFYVRHMDFDGIQDLWERTMERILNYAGEALFL